jgi:hypothetical protein
LTTQENARLNLGFWKRGSGSPIVSHMYGHKTTQKTKIALQTQNTDWPASKEREAAFMLGKVKDHVRVG